MKKGKWHELKPATPPKVFGKRSRFHNQGSSVRSYRSLNIQVPTIMATYFRFDILWIWGFWGLISCSAWLYGGWNMLKKCSVTVGLVANPNVVSNQLGNFNMFQTHWQGQKVPIRSQVSVKVTMNSLAPAPAFTRVSVPSTGRGKASMMMNSLGKIIAISSPKQQPQPRQRCQQQQQQQQQQSPSN